MVELPYPLYRDSALNFLTEPEYPVVELGMLYWSCGDLSASRSLFEERWKSGGTDLRLLSAWLLWGGGSKAEAVKILAPRTGENRTQRGFLGLARAALLWLGRSEEPARRELHRAEVDLGKNDPALTRLKSWMERKPGE